MGELRLVISTGDGQLVCGRFLTNHDNVPLRNSPNSQNIGEEPMFIFFL